MQDITIIPIYLFLWKVMFFKTTLTFLK
jgi:hypothetical protein